VANRVGKLTKKTADYLARQAAKPVVGSGGQGSSAPRSSSMRNLVDAARGGVVAAGTIYAGLEDQAKVLGSCLKDNSVDVVQHR